MWYTVNAACEFVDIDECQQNNGGCAYNAVCINLDGTLSGTSEVGGSYCLCPDGLFGDGLLKCDTVQHVVHMILAYCNLTETGNFLTPSWIEEKAAQSQLVDLTGVVRTFAAYVQAVTGTQTVSDTLPVTDTQVGSGRRLLSTQYDHLALSFEVADWDTMQTLSQDINAELVAAYLTTQSNGLNQISVLQETTTLVTETPGVFTYVAEGTPGFLVSNVTYSNKPLIAGPWDPVSHVWKLIAHFYAPSGMYYALFASKSHAGKAPTLHECVTATDVCCLHCMSQDHHMGGFAAYVATTVSPFCTEPGGGALSGYPNATALQLPSAAILHRLPVDGFVKGVFSDLNNSSVELTEVLGVPTVVDISISQQDIMSHIAKATSFGNGTQYSFAMGMLFFKPLSIPRIYAAIGQVQLSVFASNSVTFVASSHQDYTFLENLDVTIYETEYRPTLVTLHRLQFARVTFILPGHIYNGTVPGTSIEFAVATDILSVGTADWHNPCFSDMDVTLCDSTGQWDDAAGLQALYGMADARDCAMGQTSYCSAGTETFAEPYVDYADDVVYTIDIPLGDDVLTAEVLTSTVQNYLFLCMIVKGDQNVANAGVMEVLTQVSAQILLDDSNVMRMCTKPLASELHEADFTLVSLSVGVQLTPMENGQNDQRDVVVFSDIANTVSYDTLNAFDVSSAYQAVSVIDSLLTVAIMGKVDYFQQYEKLASFVYFDHVTTVHVRDDAKYHTMAALVANATAYTTAVNAAGFYTVTLSNAFNEVCYGAHLIPDAAPDAHLDCVVQTAVSDRTVDPLQARLIQQPIEQDVLWFVQQFGASVFVQDVAAQFATNSRVCFGLNFRYKVSLWVIPTYNWPDTTTIGMSDCTFVFMAYSVF